jgi:hypothetical protein
MAMMGCMETNCCLKMGRWKQAEYRITTADINAAADISGQDASVGQRLIASSHS